MSDIQDNFYNLSAVLDLLQNNAPPAQRPVLRLVGDHLRLLALCMDLPSQCPSPQTPHSPPSGADQNTPASSYPGKLARPAAPVCEVSHVHQ